jgi:hypothetical protein
MNFGEMINNCFFAMDDFDRVHKVGKVMGFLNQGIEKLAQQTHILRSVQALTGVNGIVNIKPTPDSVGMSGRILRVEDIANGGTEVQRYTLGEMDILLGGQWRTVSVGSLVAWIPGMPNQPASGATNATQDGYSTITVYPLQPTPKVNVYFESTPTRLTDNSQVSEIPNHFHYGVCFYAAWAILMAEGNQSKASLIEFCKGQWMEYVAQANAEVAAWGGKTA